MADDSFAPGGPSDEGSSPSDADASELGSQVPAELGAQGQAATPLTVEQLAEQFKTLEKRFGDTQTSLHGEKAKNAALLSQIEAQRSAPLRQGVNPQFAPSQQFDPFGGVAPTFDPGYGQQPPNIAGLALELAAEGQIKAGMADVAETLGIKITKAEQQAIRDHLNAIGSFDVLAGAKVVLHDRLMEEARESGKATTLKAVQESQKAVVQTPPGQTGQPKREYPSGIRGYDQILADAEKQGKL